jgi:N-acetylneuraminic acid mutarotase
VVLGSGASFSVTATGNGVLSYQWQKGGVDIAGATLASYSINAVAATDADNYDCVITNTLSGTVTSTTSAVATLVVNSPATITAQASNQTVVVGTGASFTVVATGSGALTYQWQKGGVDIAGATAATLAFTAVADTDAGSYDCVITNTLNGTTTSVTSNAVTLTVVDPPVTPVVSLAATVSAGKSGLIASTQTQGTTSTYTWTLTNGTVLSGQGTSTITYVAGSVGTLGASVTVSNIAGNATGSASATVVPAVTTPDLLCATSVHPNDAWMKAIISAQSGVTYTWNIVSGTTSGSIGSGQGTTLVTFAAGSTTGSFQLQVTVQNAAGDTATATRTIQVQTGTWVVEDGGPMFPTGTSPAMAVLPSGRVLVTGGQLTSGAQATAMIYSPVTGTWFPTAPMNVGRYNHAATVLSDGTVLVTGGRSASASLASAEIYDPIAGTWTLLAGSMSNARNQHTATLLNNGKVLIAAGNSTVAVATADLYDPATGAFTPTGALSVPRYQHTATLLQNGQVLVAGGTGGSGTGATNANATLEVYDPTAGTFTKLAALLLRTRVLHSATLLNDGTVLLAGSSTAAPLGGQTNPEIFNPATSATALTTGALAQGRYAHAAVLLNDGTVLLTGGQVNGSQLAAEIYNPTTGAFAATTAMQAGRYLHRAARLASGKVLVAGGSAQPVSVTSSAEVYDPTAATWSFAGGQVLSRQQHTATRLVDGRILVVGGQGSAYSTTLPDLKSAQIYDPSTATWSATGSLTTGRFDHTATLLNDGRVLITGGLTPVNVTTNTCEIWDPATGIFTVVAPMILNAAGRRSHTATLLPDGKVLVTGGRDSALPTNFIASAEVYDPALNTWSAPTGTQPAMSSVRFYHTATLAGGKVVVIGGKTSNSTVTSSVDIYDPVAQSFTPLTALGLARGFHTATLLNTGKILVTGGQTTGPISLFATNTAELYDPTGAGATTPTTANLASALTNHVAVLLPDGRVLITGGNNAPPVTQSELYDPTADSFTVTGPLSAGRYFFTANLLSDGSVMITGGALGSDAITEIYRP